MAISMASSTVVRDFFCRLRVLSTECENDHAGAIQHDLVAFAAQKFAPNTYAPLLEQDFELRAEYVLLFDHESLRHSIEILVINYLWREFTEVPASVLPALFSVGKLRQCNIQCASDPTEWINRFIRVIVAVAWTIFA
ncbi:hypothetical protein AAVH_27324 [Aphelenchoides avenae]|nr:hypothetical protein AAVH_27324 [Aphelenchus avenae]